MSASGRAGFRLLRLETADRRTAASHGEGSAGEPAREPHGVTPAQPPLAALAEPSLLAEAELLVPAESPIFAGHFPGRPLLPGIAHLALLHLVLEELAARGGLAGGGTSQGNAIVAVQSLRWRRPVAPGDRLALRLHAADAAGAGAYRFELRRRPVDGPPDGEVASLGTVQTRGFGETNGPTPGSSTADAAAARSAAALAPLLLPAALREAHPPAAAAGFPSVTGLLPHAPPARLLTAVLAAGADGIVGTGAVPADHPLATGATAPGFLALELAAQAAAAGEALARHPGGRPRIGYLARVRGAHLAPTLPTAGSLRVTAVPAGGAAALATYDVRVEPGHGGEPLAVGAISTFLPDL